MEQVYEMTYRKELEGEKVPNEEKIFSIYEQHADIIVKGGRQAEFGHKVNLATGKSNLILDCETVKDNSSDKTLFEDVLTRVKENYGCTPRHVATDGGYASMANQEPTSFLRSCVLFITSIRWHAINIFMINRLVSRIV